MDLKSEWEQGRLCEQGFMKERYDEESGELVRKLTPKGKQEVRKMLEEKEWQIELKKLLLEIPIEERKRAILNVKKFLNENEFR